MKFRIDVIRCLAVLGGLACCAVSWAQTTSTAQEFPSKGQTITLIVPWGAGGMIDTMGRVFGDYWDSQWGTKTVVVNKAGASGQIGLNELVKAKPDGYTIGFTHDFETQMSYQDLDAQTQYSKQDFIPVARVQRTPVVFVVNADSPFRSVRDLVEAAKSQPGRINFGTAGPRTEAIALAKILAERYGANLTLVPFRDVPSALQALLGDQVDVAISNIAVALPLARAGKLRVLTILSKERTAFFPEVPTSFEQGFDLESWSSTGVSLPKGTSIKAVDAWAAMIRQTVTNPKIHARMEAAGVTLGYLGPTQYAEYWGEVEAATRDVLLSTNGKVRAVK